MADEPMTDEQLAEIRSRVDDQVATQVEAEYLLAEVDRLRAREAAAMAIVMRLAVVEPQDLGDDRYHGGFGYAPEDIDPLIDELSALLTQE